MVPIRPPYSGALEAQGWGSWRHHAQPRKPITTSARAPNKFHQEIGGGVTLRVSYKKIQRMMQGYLQTIFKNKLFLYSPGRKKTTVNTWFFQTTQLLKCVFFEGGCWFVESLWIYILILLNYFLSYISEVYDYKTGYVYSELIL